MHSFAFLEPTTWAALIGALTSLITLWINRKYRNRKNGSQNRRSTDKPSATKGGEQE